MEEGAGRSGNFGVARLMRNRSSTELVAVKYINGREKINESVQRNRQPWVAAAPKHHPVQGVIQILLTQTHLAIVMEYAYDRDLSDRICNAGRFSEEKD